MNNWRYPISGPTGRSWRRGGVLAWWGALVLACWVGRQTLGAGEVSSGLTAFHFGFSTSVMANVNHNDAKAAVKAWARIVAQERDIPADPDPSILDSVREMEAGIRAGNLDAMAMTLPEYRHLAARFSFAELFVCTYGGKTNLNYLLLVRADSGIQSLADLRGKTLNFFESPKTSLALAWLDIELARQRAKIVDSHFARVTRARKLTSAVLPVFFKQCDATLVDSVGYETMCELNPQVGKQLKPLLASALFMPTVFCLRADYQPRIKPRVLEALAQLHQSPAGQQLLTALQYERMQLTDRSCLEEGLELLATHERMCGPERGRELGILMNADPARRSPP